MLREDKDSSSSNDIKSKEGKIIQSTNQSLSQLNVALGLVACLIVLTGGVFVMTGPQADVTIAGLDWKRNETHIIQDTRSVPPSMHNMSHHQSVSDQVNASHSQSHHNSSLSQESSVNDTLRVKRHYYHPYLYYHRPATTTTTPTPWIEAYNETHHFKVNYTHKQMLEIPVEKVNVTTLGFSKDAQRASVLFMWHKEKHSKCENYKRFLEMCLKNDMVSEDHVDFTNIVELLK